MSCVYKLDFHRLITFISIELFIKKNLKQKVRFTIRKKFNNKIIQHLKVNFLSLNFIHSRRNWIFIVNCNLLFKHTTWIQYGDEKFFLSSLNNKRKKESTTKCHCEKWNTGNLNKTWKTFIFLLFFWNC